MIYSISDHAVVGADGERPHHRSEPAAKMELRRLQHRAGSRRGQRSHPLVWSSSPFFYYFLFKTCMEPCSLLLIWLRLLFFTLKPSSHFQGPVQEGRQHPCNSLICVPSRFTFLLEVIKTAKKFFLIKKMSKEKRDQKTVLTLGLYDFFSMFVFSTTYSGISLKKEGWY